MGTPDGNPTGDTNPAPAAHVDLRSATPVLTEKVVGVLGDMSNTLHQLKGMWDQSAEQIAGDKREKIGTQWTDREIRSLAVLIAKHGSEEVVHRWKTHLDTWNVRRLTIDSSDFLPPPLVFGPLWRRIGEEHSGLIKSPTSAHPRARKKAQASAVRTELDAQEFNAQDAANHPVVGWR